MTTEADGLQRPIAVTVIAGFLWFAALVSLIVGFTLVLPHTPVDRIWELNRPAHDVFRRAGRAAGLGFLLMTLIGAVSAIGFARGRRWAWWIAVSAMVANIAGDVVSLFIKRDLVRNGSGALIAGALLLLLFARAVRLYFASSPPQAQ